MPILTALAILAGAVCVSAQSVPPAQLATSAAPIIEAGAVATADGFPGIGKWMIDRDGTIAHWLGQIVGGKRLYEPVNIIVIDARAASAEEAKARLLAAATAAGYPVRFGHSAGYRGWIGGEVYPQLPQGRDDAFSNRLFEETNNHGRIFGPHRFEGGFVFIGAFSRERVNVLEWPGHRYASFNQARDDFVRRLDALTAFKASGAVTLGNAIEADPAITTGDHDGRALVLRAGR